MLQYKKYREENCLTRYFQGIPYRLKTNVAAVNKKIKISLIFGSFTFLLIPLEINIMAKIHSLLHWYSLKEPESCLTLIHFWTKLICGPYGLERLDICGNWTFAFWTFGLDQIMWPNYTVNFLTGPNAVQ